MDHLNLRDRELEIDLESGGNTSEEDEQKMKILNRDRSRVLNCDGSFKVDSDITSRSNLSKFDDIVEENVELLIDKSSRGEESPEEDMAFLEKRYAKEKRKNTNSKRPPKPPLPPNGPLLDAADQKLVREIAELATKKRARIERIKALKKKKAAKASPSSNSSSLTAMLITLIFCLIIIFQGSLGSRI